MVGPGTSHTQNQIHRLVYSRPIIAYQIFKQNGIDQWETLFTEAVAELMPIHMIYMRAATDERQAKTGHSALGKASLPNSTWICPAATYRSSVLIASLALK